MVFFVGDEMKKNQIIKKNRDFKKILDQKRVFRNSYYNIYIERNLAQKNLFGISVSKKLGNAVLRNKLKRQVKSIVDSKKDFQNYHDYIIILKRGILDISFAKRKEELLSLINRIDRMED